jgi:hypothetical protein
MGMARKLFNMLNRCEQDVEPDDVTFLFLLSACSHADLAGRIVLFTRLLQNWHTTPAWLIFLAELGSLHLLQLHCTFSRICGYVGTVTQPQSSLPRLWGKQPESGMLISFITLRMVSVLAKDYW